MPRIQANRDAIDDRFSVLGFTVRTESPLFEIGVATDPQLFHANRRSERNRRNFFSSRAVGALRARRGEAVYLVPPDVLGNFVGQPKLYFGLATYPERSRGAPDFVQAPTEGNMYVRLAGLTERGLRRLTSSARTSSYGQVNGRDPSLEWGGDAWPQPSTSPDAAAAQNGAATTTSAPPAPPSMYDDGFGAFPDAAARSGNDTATATPGNAPAATAQALRRATPGYTLNLANDATDITDEGRGIEGPIPDLPADTAAIAAPQALNAPAPEYPQANRFVAAAPENYRAMSSQRTIDKIVLHITDGGANINGTIAWFRNPQAQVSAHYVIGRDGEVVQMVRHNDKAWHASSANGSSIGIEHVANTRGLAPTGAQLCASAALVIWLCDQFGVPADRSHILGHSEADPRTSHTGCPNAVWNWEHYMQMIETRSCIEPAAAIAQSLGARQPFAKRRRAIARAQEIITPFYDPADPASALVCQNDAFSQAREEWFVGVPTTSFFPHSAICQLVMSAADGSTAVGTGFYIGPNRVLTCAHNLHGMSQVTVIPARNGEASKPFGEYTVDASSWRIAPRYSGSGDWANDLAVIDNVPVAAPNGKWFSFLNATPSDQMPLVVCGYSRRSNAVPELTALMDGDKQHLHGGYAASQSDPEVIEYPILTLKRASGSPVYHLSSASGMLEALITAVHVTGEPAAQGLNRGCFITPQKIEWIEGRTTTFSLARAFGVAPTVALRADRTAARTTRGRAAAPHSWPQGLFDLRPVDLKLRVYIPAPAIYTPRPIISDVVAGGDGRGFQSESGTSRVEIAAKFHFGGDGASPSLTDVSRSFGESTNYRADDTVAVAGKPEWWRDLRPGAQPTERGTQTVTDDRVRVALGGSSNDGVVSMVENAVVVSFNVHASDPIISLAADIDATLAVMLKIDGDRVKARVRGGHDEFPAYELYANGVLVYGYDPVAQGGTPIGLLGDGAWDVNPETEYVDVGPASDVRLIPVRIGGAEAQALSQRRVVAGPLGKPAISIHWDDVPYYPQSSPASCWAASAAMIVGWRDRMSIPDSEIARMVPAIDAYRTGLWPRDRRRLADAWNLIAEPPASYTIDAWAQMLESYGPLYLDMTWSGDSGGHVRVLVGIESDGNADGSGTTMYMHDPWPDTPGKIKLSFADFLTLYEGRTGNSGGQLLYQILHADQIPAGIAPVTAAPFALTLAEQAEGGTPTPADTEVAVMTSPVPGSDFTTSTQVRGLPPPPAPIVQQLRTRSLSADLDGVEVESPIAGATLRRVTGGKGDVTWELDQLHGFKHPMDVQPAAEATAQDGAAVPLSSWPYLEASDGTRVGLDLELRWQHDGQSVGNVRLRPLLAKLARGYALAASARIADDRALYPTANPVCAAIALRIEYRFTWPDGNHLSAVNEVKLFGNGLYNAAGRWLAS